jgi:RND family efflux transporter MFP subunit
MKSIKKISVLLSASLVIFSACGADSAPGTEENNIGVTRSSAPAKEVTIFDLENDEAQLVIKKTGTTQSKQVATVSPQVSGEITNINVEVGDTVKENDLLIQLGNSLSTDLLELDLQSSEIALDLSFDSKENTNYSTQNAIELAEIAANTSYNNYLSALNNKQLNIESFNRSFVDSQINLNSAKITFIAAEDSYIDTLDKLDDLRDALDEDEENKEIEAEIEVTKTTIDSLQLNYELAENQYLKAENSIYTLKTTNQSTLDTINHSISTAEDQYTIAVKNIEAAKLQANTQKIAAENQLLQSDTKFQSSQINNSYKNIIAPIDGIVTAIEVKEGSLASPGQTLITIENPFSTVAKTSVNLEEAFLISESENIYIFSDQQFSEGEISYISPIADSKSKKIEVEVELNPQSIASEQFIDLIFEIEAENRTFIPLNSISQGDTSYTVKTVGEKNKVEKKDVIIGQIIGNYVEVLDGLDGDEKIIEAGTNFISEGETVKIVYKNNHV